MLKRPFEPREKLIRKNESKEILQYFKEVNKLINLFKFYVTLLAPIIQAVKTKGSA